MRHIVLATIVALVLTGCGNEVQETQRKPWSEVPADAAFGAMAARVGSIPARKSKYCNLDKVSDQIADNAPVDHIGVARFSGWAADTETGMVPRKVQLILMGARDYAVEADTGGSRPDVAAGLDVPAFASSGFLVNAQMSAVPVGDYKVALVYQTSGDRLICMPNVTVSVQ